MRGFDLAIQILWHSQLAIKKNSADTTSTSLMFVQTQFDQVPALESFLLVVLVWWLFGCFLVA